LEYADDTVLIAKAAAIATTVLGELEEEASKYGLALNRDKTSRLALHSEEVVRFRDGTAVPRAGRVVYLGAVVDEGGDPGPEIVTRIGKTFVVCRALKPLWKVRSLDKDLALRVLNQCAYSGLTYCLHTMVFHAGWARRIDSAQVRMARRALGIRTTYASRLLGEAPITNQEVARRASLKPLSCAITRARLKLLGHVLRRSAEDPVRAVVFDRRGHPRVLGGTARRGPPKIKWGADMLRTAEAMLKDAGILQTVNGGRGHPHSRIAMVAQDRVMWKGFVEKWFAARSWRDFQSFSHGHM